MNIITFQPEHLHRMRLQARQHAAIAWSDAKYLTALKSLGPAVTGVDSNGRVIACGGVATIPGIQVLWGYVSSESGQSFIGLHRAVVRLLSICSVGPIESTTEADFPAGCRWLEMLGFKFDRELPNYGFFGETHRRYVRN